MIRKLVNNSQPSKTVLVARSKAASKTNRDPAQAQSHHEAKEAQIQGGRFRGTAEALDEQSHACKNMQSIFVLVFSKSQSPPHTVESQASENLHLAPPLSSWSPVRKDVY